MLKKKDERPVIHIIKKGKKHGPNKHGDSWKVAYADFVTAMMALFIVLWIVGQSKKVRQSVSHYFKDPGAFIKSTGRAISSNGQVPDIESFRKDSLLSLKLNNAGQLKELKKDLIDAVDSMPEFAKFRNQTRMTLTKEGLKIDLVEDSSGVFFDIGSARLKPEAIKFLQMMGKYFRRLPNGVIIEGYTDARQYATKDYSNWALSVDRANAARIVLVEGGLRKNQLLQIRGFADRDLHDPDHPYAAANRRVSIVVALKRSSTDHFYGNLAPPPNLMVSSGKADESAASSQ